MEIRVHTLEEMWQWVQTPAYRALPDIPISPHRALSHYHNPRAQKTDPVLWTAWEAECMVGYRLVLPDTFELNGPAERIAWLSCTWVHPDARGKRIAQHLLETATEAWSGMLIGIDPSTPNVKVFERSSPYTTVPVEGRRWYLRSDLGHILPARNKRYRKVTGLLQMADAGINLFAPGRAKRPTTELEFFHLFDDEALRFVARHMARNLAQRSQTELDWILKYPWLLSSPGPGWMAGKYYFSAFARNFHFLGVKVFDKEILKAVMLLSYRDGNLKVPYVWCDEEALPECAGLLYRLALDYDANAFTTYHRGLCNALDALPARAMRKRKTFRNYVITKQLLARIDPSVGAWPLQDGDGDHIFI